MNNQIEEWLEENKEIEALVLQLDETSSSPEQAALKAFYEISSHLQLPKFPEEINEEHYKAHEELDIEPRSVIEELAILNYLAPKDDIRGRVLCAIHNVHFKEYIDWHNVTLKHFKNSIKLPKEYMVYLFGKNVDARLAFTLDGDSWVKAGASAAYKILTE